MGGIQSSHPDLDLSAAGAVDVPRGGGNGWGLVDVEADVRERRTRDVRVAGAAVWARGKAVICVEPVGVLLRGWRGLLRGCVYARAGGRLAGLGRGGGGWAGGFRDNESLATLARRRGNGGEPRAEVG